MPVTDYIRPPHYLEIDLSHMYDSNAQRKTVSGAAPARVIIYIYDLIASPKKINHASYSRGSRARGAA